MESEIEFYFYINYNYIINQNNQNQNKDIIYPRINTIRARTGSIVYKDTIEPFYFLRFLLPEICAIIPHFYIIFFKNYLKNYME